MTAKEADQLKPGDAIYCFVGGHPQTGKVLRVEKQRGCRRIFFEFVQKNGRVTKHDIRHQSARC